MRVPFVISLIGVVCTLAYGIYLINFPLFTYEGIFNKPIILFQGLLPMLLLIVLVQTFEFATRGWKDEITV